MGFVQQVQDLISSSRDTQSSQSSTNDSPIDVDDDSLSDIGTPVGRRLAPQDSPLADDGRDVAECQRQEIFRLQALLNREKQRCQSLEAALLQKRSELDKLREVWEGFNLVKNWGKFSCHKQTYWMMMFDGLFKLFISFYVVININEQEGIINNK